MTTDVLTIGEALVSFRTDAIAPGWGASAHVAGAESNVAIGLARLGHASRWVGRVSDDALGRWVLATLAAEGVDVSAALTDPHPAGAMVLEAPADHARRATYLRRGSAGAALTAADALAALPGARRVHLTGVTPALSETARAAWLGLGRAARGAGVAVSFDVNHRPALWDAATASETLREMVAFTDLLIASEDELELVAAGGEADAVASLLAAGVGAVVVKRGERGASGFTASGRVDVPAQQVPVLDVIGAGDALCAGLLSGLLDGQGLGAALERGVAVASACVSSAGDWEGLPTRAELGLG